MLRAAIAQGAAVGLHAKRFIDQGQLVPDETVLNLVGQRLEQPDAKAGWLLDGFPRRLTQAEGSMRFWRLATHHWTASSIYTSTKRS